MLVRDTVLENELDHNSNLRYLGSYEAQAVRGLSYKLKEQNSSVFLNKYVVFLKVLRERIRRICTLPSDPIGCSKFGSRAHVL